MSQPGTTNLFDGTDQESVMVLSDDLCDSQDMDLINHLTDAEEVKMQRDGPDLGGSEESGDSVCTEGLSASPADAVDSVDFVETRRQTRSRTASTAEKEKTPGNSRAGVGRSAFFPRVMLYGYRHCNKYLHESVQDSSDHSAAPVSKDPDVSDSENRPSQSTDPSNGQRKKSGRPDRELITLSKKKTGPTHGSSIRQSNRAEPTNASGSRNRQSNRRGPKKTNKRKSHKDTSFQLLRIRKSADNTGSADNTKDSDDDINKAVKAYYRRNAEMAKQNRLKKKLYLETLEKEVEDGRQTIGELESTVHYLESEGEALRGEVQYLRSVLANQSVLAKLLHNIPDVAGASLSSSMVRKRKADPAAAGAEGAGCGKKQRPPAGVCLHVDEGRVSLEACQNCADMARQALAE